MKLKIKKGDTVKVIAGNDKGVQGRVLEVYPKDLRILVEGINIRKRHTRPSQQNNKGGILSKEMPINYSNVMMIDSDKNQTRIGINVEYKNNERVITRYAKTNNKNL